MSQSIVQEVKGAVKLGQIPGRLRTYEELIDAAAAIFDLKDSGKRLEDVCKQHAQDLMFYDIMFQECKAIEDTIKMHMDVVESDLYRHYNEEMKRALSSMDIKQYIKGDPKYVAAYEILLEVVHVRRRLEAIVEAIKSLGWSLNHIVKLRVAQMEHTTL